MAYGDIGAIIDTLEFDPILGADSWAIHVAGDVYAVAYQGPANNLYVTTVSIAADGTVGDAIIATLALSPSWGVLPCIIHVAGSVFAIVYQGTNYYPTVETVSISADGATLASIQELVIVSADCRAPKIIHVAGNVYAVTYIRTGVSTVRVSTITITSAGVIAGIVDTIDLTATGSYYTEIALVAGSVYAVAYLDSVAGTMLATITINNTGLIDDAVIDSQVINAVIINYGLGLTETWTGVFAVAHVGVGNDGFVSTVTINAAGAISAVIDTLEICIWDSNQFNLLHIGGGICAAVYKNASEVDGEVTTLQVNADGTIDDAVIDRLKFDEVNFVDGMIIHISGDVYAIFYAGVGNDGFVITLDISTAPISVPHHEMCVGMGP